MSETSAPHGPADAPRRRPRSSYAPQAPAPGAPDATPAQDPSQTRATHDGLFQPGSVTWRLHADPLIGLAVLRALLLQGLHPAASTRPPPAACQPDEPWLSVTRTTEYVAMVTYGSTAEAMTVASRLRAVHALRTTVTSPSTCRADDPQLLAWAHCCLIASFLEVVTRGGLHLSGAEQDGYIAEQAVTATLVGLEPADVPRDRAQLLDYFRVIKPALDCDDATREVAERVVVALPCPPRALAPAWAPVAGLAFAALPPWARRCYAMAPLPGAAGLSEAATTVALRRLRFALGRASGAPPGTRP